MWPSDGRQTGPPDVRRFRGTSRNGRRRWTTTSTIAEMRPGSRRLGVTYFGNESPAEYWSTHGLAAN